MTYTLKDTLISGYQTGGSGVSVAPSLGLGLIPPPPPPLAPEAQRLVVWFGDGPMY